MKKKKQMPKTRRKKSKNIKKQNMARKIFAIRWKKLIKNINKKKEKANG